jgi:hypothetical protein
MLFQTTFTRLRWAASGSTVSNPVICGFEGTAYGSGAPSVDDYPRYLDFVGRSAGGRRVRFSLLSVNAALSGFRLTTSESAVIAAAHALIAAPAQAFLAIDGTDPVWYPYANTGFNAYWQRNVRV